MDRGPRALKSSPDTTVTESIDGFWPDDLRVPALTLLAHPDAGRVGERVILPELKAGEPIRLGRGEPEFAMPGQGPSRALNVRHLSRKPLLLVPGPDSGEVTIECAGSLTRAEIDGQRLEESRILSTDEIERGVVVLLGHRVSLLLHLDAAVVDDRGPSHGMVGASLEMRRLREEARIAARLDVSVLLRGESGTGKELLARAVHDASRRSDQPYLAVNMAAVPPALAASELFGAMKGAFTGADRNKQGYFERAAGGTLFLDEIGDTPEEVQPLLLRVLENGEIQPVGSAAPRRVDVRVIAATDADLEALGKSGAFRKPLLHRLGGYEIRLPPLRERRGDFGRLLVHFLRQELARLGDAEPLEGIAEDGRPWPPAGLVAWLARCRWPGNLRQLKNVARRMAIARVTHTQLRLEPELLGEPAPGITALSDAALSGPALSNSMLDDPATVSPPPEDEEETLALKMSGDDEPRAPAPSPSSSSSPHGWRPAYRKPSEVSDKELLATLRDHRYELKPTAEALGISRASLYGLVAANLRIRKASELELGEVEDALERAGGDLEGAAAELEVSVHGLRRRIKALGGGGAARLG